MRRLAMGPRIVLIISTELSIALVARVVVGVQHAVETLTMYPPDQDWAFGAQLAQSTLKVVGPTMPVGQMTFVAVVAFLVWATVASVLLLAPMD